MAQPFCEAIIRDWDRSVKLAGLSPCTHSCPGGAHGDRPPHPHLCSFACDRYFVFGLCRAGVWASRATRSRRRLDVARPRGPTVAPPLAEPAVNLCQLDLSGPNDVSVDFLEYQDRNKFCRDDLNAQQKVPVRRNWDEPVSRASLARCLRTACQVRRFNASMAGDDQRGQWWGRDRGERAHEARFVTNCQADTTTEFDAGTFMTLATLPTGVDPMPVAVDSSIDWAHIGNRASNTLSPLPDAF